METQTLLLSVTLLLALSGHPDRRFAEKSSNENIDTPVLINTCLITKDVQRLVRFYSNILQVRAKITGSDYAEFNTGVGVLAIFSATAQERYIPGSTTTGGNKSSILEFRVAHVDREYNRIIAFVTNWVKLPSNTPWGTRSMYFRDPDGNLVDFYQRSL